MKKSTGCGVLGLAILGGLMWGVWRARTPPTITNSVPMSQLSPTQQAQRRDQVQQLEAQIKDVARAGQNRENKDFALKISADQVNTLLQDRLDTEKFPLKNLRVGFEPEQVLAQGEVSLQGISGVVTLTGTVAAQNGKLQFVTQKLQIGGLPAPSDWKSKVDSQVSSKLNEALRNAPGRIDRVELQRDVMIVSGKSN